MSSSHFTNVKMLINKTTWSYCVTSGENMLIPPLETQRRYEYWMWNSQMYHVSRFWPSVTVLYITKMNPTSKNYFFLFFSFLRCLKSFWRKTKFLLRFDYANFIFRSENASSSAKIDMKPIFFILPSFSSPQILPKKTVWGCLSWQKKFTRPSPLFYF